MNAVNNAKQGIGTQWAICFPQVTEVAIVSMVFRIPLRQRNGLPVMGWRSRTDHASFGQSSQRSSCPDSVLCKVNEGGASSHPHSRTETLSPGQTGDA